jgi:hypothetical protein
MLEKVEIAELLAQYHRQVSTEPVDYFMIDEFFKEFMFHRDNSIENSYEVDFNFDEL